MKLGLAHWIFFIASPIQAMYVSISSAVALEMRSRKVLGIFRLGEYARAIGYGERSGIQLPGEEDGLIPDPQWKRINTGENWSTGDTYIASVGQGYVLGTPLQSPYVWRNDREPRQVNAAHDRS